MGVAHNDLRPVDELLVDVNDSLVVGIDTKVVVGNSTLFDCSLIIEASSSESTSSPVAANLVEIDNNDLTVFDYLDIEATFSDSASSPTAHLVDIDNISDLMMLDDSDDIKSDSSVATSTNSYASLENTFTSSTFGSLTNA